MESKNNSLDPHFDTTIDSIISELEQLAKRQGQRPIVNVQGKFAKIIRQELEQRGYDCDSNNATYVIGANEDELPRYQTPITTHFPHPSH